MLDMGLVGVQHFSMAHLTTQEVGEALKRIRQNEGLTLRELGDRMGLSAAVLSRRENGQGDLTSRQLAAYAEAYGITPEELDYRISTVKNMPLGIPVLNRGSGRALIDYERMPRRDMRRRLEGVDGEGFPDIAGLFALIAIDNSMLPAIREGDDLIFTACAHPASTRQPVEGDIVYAVFTPRPGRHSAFLGRWEAIGRGRFRLTKFNDDRTVDFVPADLESVSVLVQRRERF